MKKHNNDTFQQKRNFTTTQSQGYPVLKLLGFLVNVYVHNSYPQFQRTLISLKNFLKLKVTHSWLLCISK